MNTLLLEDVSKAIWDVYVNAERDEPNPCDEAAAEALAVITLAIGAVPVDGKDSALGYRAEIIRLLTETESQ